jgi:hypothetical protein
MLNGEKLYTSENGIQREYNEQEYAQAQADYDVWLEKLPTEVRTKRNILLKNSDWTQVSDMPNNIKTPWATYRQALRDITTQSGFPSNITWPTAPQ